MSKPLILISNDDGVHAPGIRALREVLKGVARTVIVAPHVERSASSHMITIHQPLWVEEIEKDVFAVQGMPADCVILALKRLLDEPPAWVLSGINRGPNLGTDTIYSGTVAAAMEGTMAGIPSIAISLDSFKPKYYETAAKIALSLIGSNELKVTLENRLLNVNVPDIPFDHLKGLRAAETATREYDDQLQMGTDPRGRPYYWHGIGAIGHDNNEESDCVLIRQSYATLSLLRPSFYDAEGTSKIRQLAESFL